MKKLRSKYKKTQKEIAASAGISRSYYSELESGEKVPSSHVYRLLASAFGVSVQFLKGEPEIEELPQKEVNDIRKASVNLDVALIPLVGEVRAGISMYAQSNIDSYIRVDNSAIDSEKAYFYLTVVGDSMDKLIRQGDQVLVEHTPCFEDGDIVIALFDDECATIKRIRAKGENIILIPESFNPEHTIKSYSQDEVTIVGKVIKAERFF